MFDLLLKGGWLVDGSGAPRARADVGVRGSAIVAIAPSLEAEAGVVRDCTGHVVCPGFIDTHSHSDVQLLAEPLLAMKLRQGITLEVFGQDGISVAPVRGDDREAWRQSLAGLLGDFGVAWDWTGVRGYLARVASARPAADVAYLAPHGAIRRVVMGSDARAATLEERLALQDALRTCLAEGACGMSTGLIYPPCCYADTEELIALGQALAATQAPLVVHLRSESDRLLEAAREMVRVADEAGCPVHISHLKIAGRDNWAKLEELVALLEAARGRGLRVTADQYPYAAGSTLLGAILPPWAHAGGLDATLARLGDRGERRRMREAMADPLPADWDNFWKWSGPEGIVVADVPSGRRPDWLGRNLADLAAQNGNDPFETAFDLLHDERMAVAMISFSQNEAVVDGVVRLPFANVCTDGLPGGRPHPRLYGAFPRMLGRYVRELGSLSLEEAVRKMTSQAAFALGLLDVGLVREGQRANVVVFDPETVADRATFEDPMQPPVGIRDVVVGGRLALRDGEPTGERSGRVVR